MILSICDEPSLMNIIRIVVLLINIVKAVIPIILIVFVMIKNMGAVSKHDQEEIMKTVKSCIPNVVAAVLIFLIPTFVDMVARLSFPNSEYSKCISGISREKVDAAYASKIDELVNLALETEKYSDYANAKNYLQNIKDKDLRREYESVLADLALQFDNMDNPPEICNNKNDYAKVNYSNFKWTSYAHGKGPMVDYGASLPYTIWAPDNIADLNGVSLPLIVWLHGAGETSKKYTLSTFTKFGTIQRIMNEWSSTGLDPIPAIVIAPQAPGSWEYLSSNIKTVMAAVDFAKAKYNIDPNNVVLMGHSMGGDGVVTVSYKIHTTYKKELFTAFVPFSASSLMSTAPYNNGEGIKNYFKDKKFKGFSESSSCKGFFDLTGLPLKYYKGVSHGQVPKVALTEDADGNKVSDIVEWLFGKNDSCESGSSGSSSVVQDSGILKIYYLGLGRYDGFLIMGNGTTLFVDGGYVSQGKKAVEYVKSLGITKIDGLIGSHMHNNHIDAHKEFIKAFNIGGVYYGEDPGECLSKKTCIKRSSDPTELMKMVKEKNIPMTILSIGNNVKIGNLTFDIIAPNGFVSTGSYPENSNSLNMILKFGKHKFYFSGDHVRSGEILKSYDASMLDVDVFKWPHHGLENVANNFLDTIKPEYIIVPNSSMKDAAQKGVNHTKATGYATGSDGYVLAESDGTNLTVTKFKTR